MESALAKVLEKLTGPDTQSCTSQQPHDWVHRTGAWWQNVDAAGDFFCSKSFAPLKHYACIDKRRRGRGPHATRRTAQVTPHQRPRVSFSRRRAAAPLPSPAFSSPPRAAATAAPSPEDGTPAVSSLYSSPPSVPHFVFFQIRALNC